MSSRRLDAAITTGPVESRSALLINPFYPKDPNASFGKHVLTPTLALTSFAAATPAHWQVRYWDGMYQRLFSHAWRLLIKHHLVHAVWRPLVELTRLRHVRFRERLAAGETLSRPGVNVVAAGV